MGKAIIFCLLVLVSILFSISFVLSLDPTDYQDCEIYGVCKEEITFDNNTGSVNSSEFAEKWITLEGVLDNVADIEHNWLSNLLWSVAGHIMDAVLDMAGNDIDNVGNIQGDGTDSYFNQTLLITGDSPVTADSDATLWIRAEVNHDACINLTESTIAGITICYDGTGSGIFEIRNSEDGTVYMTIDSRDSGNITFYNDTSFTSVNIESLNITGGLNISGDLVVGGNVTIGNWFNGKWNGTSPDDWIIMDDGSSVQFNSSKLSTIFYNATTIEVRVGTGAGAITDIQSYNNVPYNVTEDASDFELRVNFSVGVGGSFNQLIIRYRSAEEDLNHVPSVQIYEPDEDEWENYGSLPAEGIYHIVEFGVFDADEHVDDLGIVQVRIVQDEGVPPKTHEHNFDWVTIAKGFGTPSGEEVDPFSIHSSGDVPWMGDENGDGFNSSGWDWITANNGNFTDISATGSVTTPMVKSGSLEIDLSTGTIGFGGGPIKIDWLNGLLNSENGDTILDFSTDDLADFRDSEIRTTGQISLSKVGENIITATNPAGDLRFGAGGGTNDLQITSSGNVIIFEDLQVVGDIKGNTLQLLAGTGDYIIGTSLIPASWSVQSQLTNNQARYGFYSKDGDGTDTVLLDIYLQGTPTDRTNEKRVIVGVSSVGEAVIATEGTPTLELTLRTQANTDQIRLMADGSVEMKSGDLSVTNGDLKIISDSNFLHFGEQIGDFNISFDSTNPIFNNQGGSSFIFKNGTGFGELIANEYSVATPIFDNYNGNLLSNLRTPNEMLFSGKLNRETLTDIEKGVKQIKDTNNCWDVIKEYCWTIDDEEYIYRNCEDVLPKEIIDYEIVYKEECGIKDLNVTGVAGVGLVNRLMISELFERIKFLEENCVLK